MGYSHSYLDPKNACIESLATYPTDGEISLAAGDAWDEAINLLALLGIQANDLSTSTTAGPTDAFPPPLNSDEADPAEHSDETGAITLQCLIHVQETASWETVDSETKEEMHMLTCAAITLEIEERRAL